MVFVKGVFGIVWLDVGKQREKSIPQNGKAVELVKGADTVGIRSWLRWNVEFLRLGNYDLASASCIYYS